jgi:hypothetical protein
MKKIRRLNIVTHRDLGYFLSSLIIIYCISGIALNHVHDWNPDFIIEKEIIKMEKKSPGSLQEKDIAALSKLVGEESYKIYDSPTPDKLKIYFDNASLLVDFSSGTGFYEKVTRRPIFYSSNLLHRNSIRGWKWAADFMAILLIIISLTGLFILKGKHGLGGRGKWLVLAGAIPVALAMLINALVT